MSKNIEELNHSASDSGGETLKLLSPDLEPTERVRVGAGDEHRATYLMSGQAPPVIVLNDELVGAKGASQMRRFPSFLDMIPVATTHNYSNTSDFVDDYSSLSTSTVSLSMSSSSSAKKHLSNASTYLEYGSGCVSPKPETSCFGLVEAGAMSIAGVAPAFPRMLVNPLISRLTASSNSTSTPTNMNMKVVCAPTVTTSVAVNAVAKPQWVDEDDELPIQPVPGEPVH